MCIRDSSIPENMYPDLKTLCKSMNKGGLRDPCEEIMTLLFNCEILYREFETFISQSGNNKFDVNHLEDKICIDSIVNFPECCNLKRKIISHFFVIRGYN